MHDGGCNDKNAMRPHAPRGAHRIERRANWNEGTRYMLHINTWNIDEEVLASCAVCVARAYGINMVLVMC